MILNLVKKIFICLIGVIIFWIVMQKSLKSIVMPVKKQSNPSNPSNPSNVKIICYNIQKLPWIIKKLDPIIELLNKFDIILLQECFDEMNQNLEDLFPTFNIYRGKLKNINLMNSGLVIMSKFPFIEDRCFFHIYENSNKYTDDSLAEKGFISVDIIINNQNITFINTHLQCSNYSRYDQYALLQFDELCEYLKKIKNKFIVGGDFNIDVIDLQKNKSETIKKFKHNYSDNDTIYVDFKTSDSVAYPKANYVGLRYDYFISNFTINKVKTINTFYSDHLPVTSAIKF
jgi:endonuclease/exonuclease/phosphatase family metal-dependent hydrolase